MGIPSGQLETWSHQGSITQSSATYQSIKSALEDAKIPYSQKSYSVFLQGSYGNATNIFKESDVDIVIQCNSGFFYDLSALNEDQKLQFKSAHPDCSYSYAAFKADVIKVLKDKYGSSVDVGAKAITISANGSRRKADVVAAFQFRRYNRFLSLSDYSCAEGICFFTGDGTKIVNYPKFHSENLTNKHQQTSSRFKPMARILKNMRARLVDAELLESGDAPSYYIEGLLYNVPNSKFVANLETTFMNSLIYIAESDRSNFLCANEMYLLLKEDSAVSWRAEKCDKFISAVIDMWTHW